MVKLKLGKRKSKYMKLEDVKNVLNKNARTMVKIMQLLESQNKVDVRSDAVTRKIEQLKLRVNRRLVKAAKWIDTPAHERLTAPPPKVSIQEPPMQYMNAVSATKQQAPKRAPQRQPTATTYHGVYRDGSRWIATINQMGKQYYIGHFNTEHEAKLAYARATGEVGASSGHGMQRDIGSRLPSFGADYGLPGTSLMNMTRTEPSAQSRYSYGFGSESYMDQALQKQAQKPLGAGPLGLDFLNPGVNQHQLQNLLQGLNTSNISALLAMQKQAVHQAQMQFNSQPQDANTNTATHSLTPSTALSGLYPYTAASQHYMGSQPSEPKQSHAYHGVSPSLPQHQLQQGPQQLYNDPQMYTLPQNLPGLGPLPPSEFDPRYHHGQN